MQVTRIREWGGVVGLCVCGGGLNRGLWLGGGRAGRECRLGRWGRGVGGCMGCRIGRAGHKHGGEGWVALGREDSGYSRVKHKVACGVNVGQVSCSGGDYCMRVEVVFE